MPPALAVANEQEILTRVNSLSMLRNLLRMSFCQIAFARGLFPEDYFRSQNVMQTPTDSCIEQLGTPSGHTPATNSRHNVMCPLQINGLTMKTLGGKRSSEQAATFLKWIENGVFDALNRGFLDTSALVVTTESGATFEVWTLCVKWSTDENGKEYPTLCTNAPGGKANQRFRHMTPYLPW